MDNNVLKGGEFLIKESSPQEVFIPEDLNEETKMMADMVKDFLINYVNPKLDAIDKQEDGLVPSILEEAGNLGLLGTSIPEDYEGLGLDFNTNTAISMELGKGHSVSVAIAAHTGIGTLPILYYGTEEQKTQYLPDLATGRKKAAYCLTEPGSGSDALAAKTRADLSKDGTHYILNGQKMWITNGGFADLFIVFAQIDGDKFTGFIVDANTEGVSRGNEENKMGIKGSSTRQIFFENVKVPKENLLGEIGKGHKIAFNILNIGRFKLCAMALGGAKSAMNVSVNYANERQQFKQSIGNFGAIKHKLAEQAIQYYVGETVTYRASDLIQKKIEELKGEGKAYHEALMDSAEEYAIECAMLKVYGSEVLDYIVDENVQIHGGYGFSEEYPAARAYRDSRINRIFEGTNEINRLLTVDMLLKKALKGTLDLMGPAMAVQNELMGIPDMTADEPSTFSEEEKAIANVKKAVLMISGAAVQKLMQKLQDEQEIIMNVADMLIELFAIESVYLRVKKLAEKNGEDSVQQQLKIMKVYFSDAIERINLHGKHAINSFAEGDEQRMMLLGLKRFTKYANVNTKELRRSIADQLLEANKYVY